LLFCGVDRDGRSSIGQGFLRLPHSGKGEDHQEQHRVEHRNKHFSFPSQYGFKFQTKLLNLSERHTCLKRESGAPLQLTRVKRVGTNEEIRRDHIGISAVLGYVIRNVVSLEKQFEMTRFRECDYFCQPEIYINDVGDIEQVSGDWSDGGGTARHIRCIDVCAWIRPESIDHAQLFGNISTSYCLRKTPGIVIGDDGISVQIKAGLCVERPATDGPDNAAELELPRQ